MEERSYTYDRKGLRTAALIQKGQGESQSYTYTYDRAGRLATVSLDGTELSAYSYDGMGNRISPLTEGILSIERLREELFPAGERSIGSSAMTSFERNRPCLLRLMKMASAITGMTMRTGQQRQEAETERTGSTSVMRQEALCISRMRRAIFWRSIPTSPLEKRIIHRPSR